MKTEEREYYMLVLDIKDTWGLLWLQNLKKKKSRNEEREADLSQRGPPHCGGYSPASMSCFREEALGSSNRKCRQE